MLFIFIIIHFYVVFNFSVSIHNRTAIRYTFLKTLDKLYVDLSTDFPI